MSNQAATQDGAGGGGDYQAHEPSFSLVNSSTGLANDYLNVFNEILLLIEFLPTMPEMTDEALAWQPRTYREYFQQSPLPGAREAARRYDKIDPGLRDRFESLLTRLNEIALRAQRKVAEEMAGPNFPESIAEPCETTAAAMRAGLDYVARLINEDPAKKPRGKKARIAKKDGN
ncbi:MAG TPA: hypothetical protein VMU18_07030 [Rhodoblastus sp.]|nr:hypothetical protein [Rhodoblastus sp.]